MLTPVDWTAVADATLGIIEATTTAMAILRRPLGVIVHEE
jgi:hypothetical protein